jgi:broad specificity phosphatase PhoE
MSGRWKIKHPDMKPLALRAKRLAPPGTTYTWIPRERNKHADRILNEALDAQAGKPPRRTRPQPAAGPLPADEPTSARTPDPAPSAQRDPAQGTTTLILVRHGVTVHTTDRRFSGGLGGRNPGLTDEGRAQARATADWLSPLAEGIDVVISSPVRRTEETAEIVAARLGKTFVTEDGLAEMEFGTWEGMTFEEVRAAYPDDLEAWLGSVDTGPGGGESLRVVEKRVLGSLDRVLTEHAGRTVLAVSHVTPIKLLVAHALGAPLESVHRMELAPASVTVLSYYGDGRSSLRMFNGRPTDSAFIGR